MIHSLSGGTIQDVGYYNFAKVQLDTGEIMYYIYNKKTKIYVNV